MYGFNDFIIKNLIKINSSYIKILIGYLARKDDITIYSIILRIIIIIIIIIGTPRSHRINEYVNYYFYGFFIYIIFIASPLFATRINMQFKILELIIFPEIIKLQKRNKLYFIAFTFIDTMIFIKMWYSFFSTI